MGTEYGKCSICGAIHVQTLPLPSRQLCLDYHRERLTYLGHLGTVHTDLSFMGRHPLLYSFLMGALCFIVLATIAIATLGGIGVLSKTPLCYEARQQGRTESAMITISNTDRSCLNWREFPVGSNQWQCTKR